MFFERAGHRLQKAHSLMLLTTNKGRDSSGVERMTSNHKAAGSNPARGFSAQYLGSLHFINFIGTRDQSISPKASRALQHTVTLSLCFRTNNSSCLTTDWLGIQNSQMCCSIFGRVKIRNLDEASLLGNPVLR